MSKAKFEQWDEDRFQAKLIPDPGKSADIIHHTHYHRYTAQVVCAPTYHVFLDIVQGAKHPMLRNGASHQHVPHKDVRVPYIM
jgi:hypothetical protein